MLKILTICIFYAILFISGITTYQMIRDTLYVPVEVLPCNTPGDLNV